MVKDPLAILLDAFERNIPGVNASVRHKGRHGDDYHPEMILQVCVPTRKWIVFRRRGTVLRFWWDKKDGIFRWLSVIAQLDDRELCDLGSVDAATRGLDHHFTR
jgi:hypothetical protein